MKNKRLNLVITIVSILVLAIAGAYILVCNGYDVSTGIYLESKDGTAILICERTPIVMSNRTERNLYDNLCIGDKILVIHDGIQESYPAGTGAYAVFKVNSGSAGEIPPSVIAELVELGWIEETEDIKLGLPSGEAANDDKN